MRTKQVLLLTSVEWIRCTFVPVSKACSVNSVLMIRVTSRLLGSVRYEPPSKVFRPEWSCPSTEQYSKLSCLRASSLPHQWDSTRPTVHRQGLNRILILAKQQIGVASLLTNVALSSWFVSSDADLVYFSCVAGIVCYISNARHSKTANVSGPSEIHIQAALSRTSVRTV